MINEFDLLVTTLSDVEVVFPRIGNLRLQHGRQYQLLNVDIDSVNIIRQTFINTSVKVELNKRVKSPYYVFDYRDSGDVRSVKEVITDRASNTVKEDPFETIGNFVLPSGKYRGKKLKELTDENLKNIYHFSKVETVRSAISSYQALKRNR